MIGQLPAASGRGSRQMHTAWTLGKAAKLAEEFCCASPLLFARNFHASSDSHLCESVLSCGNSRLSMVYSRHSRMLCRFTFAAEGHAKVISPRVNIPKLSAVSGRPFMGTHPSGKRHAFCCNLPLMKAPLRNVQPSVHRGDVEFSARALARASVSNPTRDAVCANQQQQLHGAQPREFRPVCVQLSVRYTQS